MRILLVAAAALVLGLSSAGCDEAEKAINRGGDTPCNEFIAQDKDKQRTTVTKYLEQERGDNAADQANVDGAIAAIDLMCRAQANADVPIKNADLTGILVPK